VSLDITNNRVRIIGADGNATFDSNSRHLIVTDYKTGTFPIEAVDAFNTGPRVFTRTHDLGPVNSRANIVTGFQINAYGEMQPIGGTYFAHSVSEFVRPDAYQTRVTGDLYFTTAVYYTIEIVSARLRAVVDYRFPGGSEFPMPARTVRYWAFCGTFDF
jgi:hypothetical protein